MSHSRKLLLGTACLVMLSGVVGGLASCGGADEDTAPAVGAGSTEESQDNLASRRGALISAGGAGGSGTDTTQGYTGAVGAPEPNPDAFDAAPSKLGPLDQRVIKTGDLPVEVARGDFQKALNDSVAIADGYGGFVLSNRQEGEGADSGVLVIRVPAGRFEEAMRAFQDIGDVEGQNITGQDVSEEFVDLQARLRNFVAQEEVLLRLMDRSQSVSDTIRVQSQLQQTQLEIERIRGRLRFLDDQTAFSTITVHLAEVGASPTKPGTIERAWERAGDVFLGVIASVIVGAGFLVPVAILLLVLYAVVRIVRPRVTV